jgi:hypothetical protein
MWMASTDGRALTGDVMQLRASNSLAKLVNDFGKIYALKAHSARYWDIQSIYGRLRPGSIVMGIYGRRIR